MFKIYLDKNSPRIVINFFGIKLKESWDAYFVKICHNIDGDSIEQRME